MAFPFFGKKRKLASPPPPPRHAGRHQKKSKPAVRAAASARAAVDAESMLKYLKHLKEGVDSLRTFVLETQNRHKALESRFNGLRGELSKSRKVDAVRAEDDLQKIKNNVFEIRDSFETFKANLSKDMESMRGAGKTHFGLTKEHGEKIKPLNSAVNSLKSSVSGHESELERIGDSLFELKEADKKNFAKLKDDSKTLALNVSSINAVVSSLKMKDSEQDSRLEKADKSAAELKKTDAVLNGLVEIVHSDLKKMEDGVHDVTKEFNPLTLKRLKGSLENVNTFTKDLVKKEQAILKDVGKVTRNISSIEQHAQTLEDENAKAKSLADELQGMHSEFKETLEEERKELDDMKTRFNAAISSSVDMEKDRDELHRRITGIEGKLNTILEMRRAVAETRTAVEALSQRIAEIERTVVRTFVIK